jgi:hypothetical protein
MRRSIAFLAAVSLLAAGTGAFAAPCKDAKGKFIKCPAAAAPAAKRCVDSKTKKFAKCGAPGAIPMK